jgi:hypothetical protein
VIDPEGGNMVFDIKCPGLPFDLFEINISYDVMSLVLNKNPLTKPKPGEHQCHLTVQDA